MNGRKSKMAVNDPAQDYRKAPPAGQIEFEQLLFDDILEGDLFWQTDQNASTNHAYRKLTETTAQDTRTQLVYDVTARQIVYQKL